MKVRGYFMLYVSLRCNNLWYIWNSEIFYADNVTKRQGQHHRLCRRVYIYYLRYRRTLGNKFRQNGGRNSVFSVNKEESHINNILTSSKSIFVCICLCIYWHTKWQWFATYSINIFAYIFWVWTMSNIQIYIIVTMIALNTKRYVYHITNYGNLQLKDRENGHNIFFCMQMRFSLFIKDISRTYVAIHLFTQDDKSSLSS